MSVREPDSLGTGAADFLSQWLDYADEIRKDEKENGPTQGEPVDDSVGTGSAANGYLPPGEPVQPSPELLNPDDPALD